MIASLLTLLLAVLQPAEQPSAPACTRSSSVEASVTDIGRDPQRFLDRCVRVSGLFAGLRMLSGREGAYLVSRYGPDGNVPPANLIHRIGIDNQEMRSLRLPAPARAEVIGRVDSCQRRFRRIADRGGIPFLGGYCHYEVGPTVVVDEYRLLGGRVERLVGERARNAFGNLDPPPTAWIHRPVVEALARDFLAALRSGDQAALSELHGIGSGSGDELDRRLLRSLLEDADSTFAQIRNRASPQTAIFVGRQGVPGERQASEPVSGIICFCRSRDCTGRWPISTLDADSAPERPYVCTRVEQRRRSARGVRLRTQLPAPGFLAEPARTAFRR